MIYGVWNQGITNTKNNDNPEKTHTNKAIINNKDTKRNNLNIDWWKLMYYEITYTSV